MTTAIDEKTKVYNIEGYPLMVEAAVFNKRISELEAQLELVYQSLSTRDRELEDEKAKIKAKDEQIEALRKHYSERLYRFSLNHERYKFIRDEENWSVDVDGINDWEILTELSLDGFDSHIDSCMEKAGWNYPIKAEADAAEALQSSKPSVEDAIEHVRNLSLIGTSDFFRGYYGACDAIEKYLSEQKES